MDAKAEYVAACSAASALSQMPSESMYHHTNLDIDSMFPLYQSDRRYIMVEGELGKWCSWSLAFKQRYFVLEDCGRLSYFKSARDRHFPERAKRVIPVNVDSSLAVAQTRRRDRITIEIRPARDDGDDGRALRLGFESRGEFERWHLALAEAQQSVLYVKT